MYLFLTIMFICDRKNKCFYYLFNFYLFSQCVKFYSPQMSIYSYLQKRLQNVKTPQKRQGPIPARGHPNRRHHIDFSTSDQGEDYDAESSGGSTIILHQKSGSSSCRCEHVILAIMMGIKARQYYDD